MKSTESIDKTAKLIGAFDSINYGVYCLPEQLVRRSEQLVLMDTKRILLDLLRMLALAKLLIHLSSV